ncbi:hypothetical protein E4U31_001721 [Claviceps sp. LM219 group G6]|nr:hypothetical protein E4U31_001721 [Claviceps sp. LM219 group G6]
MSAVASPEVETPNREKRSKKDKSSKSKSERKRAREEEDAAADGERKHKKTKSILAGATAPKDIIKKEKKASKSSKKESRLKVEDDAVQDDVLHSQATAAAAADPIEHGASKSEKKVKKKNKKQKREPEPSPPAQPEADDGDAMDIDEPAEATSSGIYQPPDMPANPQFPFFKQTVSLYEPIYPNGWAQPVTNAQDHHLQQLQNKYVPSLRGVLLDYSNVSLGPEPGRAGAAADDESPTTLLSKGEYAVGFGWITADVGLFVPSRGAWMEGSVNLQTEGHIGVVCFGKFNASIEASRLPPSWKWVSNESPDASGFEETASVITADDHGVVRQIHSTGFWIDGSGTRVKGKVRFRIRNFDAGTSGETSYLSLEGTMLDKASEKKLIQEEARLAQVRREKKGGRKMERRRAPDFSMTRFAMQEDENQGDDPAAAPAAESKIVKFDE